MFELRLAWQACSGPSSGKCRFAGSFGRPAMTWELWKLLPCLVGLVVGRETGASGLPSARRIDLDELSDARRRDLGLMDGRGPSLRRPERDDGFRR
jgi:hypothetical protein